MTRTTASTSLTRTAELFRRFSTATAAALGSPTAFVLALVACAVWAATGPFVGYSDTWQLTINTATTVITFLAVFVIQNTQNRDTLATQLKLDELLRAVAAARTGLVNLESCTDEELARLREEFERLGRRAGGPGGSLAAR
jgi:low affinity Fe/Cu permease